MPRGNTRYHYILLGLCLLASVSAWGVRWAAGILLDPLAIAGGWSYGQTTLATAIFALVSGLMLPPTGWLVDRFGARLPITVGLFLIGVGLITAGRAQQLWQLYLGLGVLAGLGFCLSGSAATTALISRWFDQGRGFAIGINNTGIQWAQVVWGPLIGGMILAGGLSWTLQTLGIVMALGIAPVMLLALRSAPPGSLPAAGGPEAAGAASAAGGMGYGFFRRPEFWLLSGGLTSCGFAMGMIVTHLPGMFLRAGASPFWVASSISLSGLSGVVGQMLSGWLSDRWGQGQMLTLIYAYRAVTTVVIILFPGLGVLMAFALGFGLLGSGTLTATASACSAFFGRGNVGKTFSFIYMTHQVGSMLGSWLGGWAIDATGSYRSALVAAAVVSAGGALFSAMIPRLQARARRLAAAAARSHGA